MRVEYRQEYPAPVETVWNTLLDPDVLARHIPGCKRLEPDGDGVYRAVLEVGIGPVKGTYTGWVELRDQRPPTSYRLVVEGDGAPGHVKGEGLIELSPTAGGTELRVEGDAAVAGTLASVGQRLLGAVARMLIGSFFSSMAPEIEARAGAASSAS